MDIRALPERGLQHRVVGFPDHYLQVRPVKVHVEEGIADVRAKHAADVGKGVRIAKQSNVPAGGGLADTLRFLTGDVLQIGPATKGVLGGG